MISNDYNYFLAQTIVTNSQTEQERKLLPNLQATATYQSLY